MSATTAPYRSPLPAGRDGFAQLLHAEWTKFRTVRGWVIATAVAALVIVLFSYLGSSGSHSGYCTGSGPSSPGQGPPGAGCHAGHPPVAIGPGGQPVVDAYYLVHQPLIGDGSVTARVTSFTGVTATATGGRVAVGSGGLTNPHAGLQPWAKAGVLITPSTAQGAAYAAVMVTGSRGVRMQDDYTHDVAGGPAAVSAAAPRWLRLTRTGDTITGYQSADGMTWTKIATVHLGHLPSTVQVGLFVTSPVSTNGQQGAPTAATAIFDHATIAGTAPGAWAGDSIGTGPNSDYPTLVDGQYQQSGATTGSATTATFTVTGSGDIGPRPAGGMFGGDTVANTLLGGFVGLLVMIVVAALFITTEYRRGMILTTLAASPKRGRVLAAKAVVIGAVTFVVALAALAVSAAIGTHALEANGNYMYPAGFLTDVRVIAGTAALLAVAAVLALAVGTALRRSSGAVTAVILALIVPYILGLSLPAGASRWVLRLTPTAAFAIQQTVGRFHQVSYGYEASNGYYPLGPWAGFAVLCAYTALALGLATYVLRTRDA